MESVKKFLSLVKFSHTIFAMPFALIGFSYGVSESVSSIMKLLPVVACMIFARNAAMAYNRYADRKFDKLNPRTASREIPSGKISERSALVFTIVNSLLFVLSCLFINSLALMLSPVALIVILGYSLTKRFTWLCHIVLGLALSIAPIGAYIAVTGYFSAFPIILSFIVLSWVGGFDIIYSLQDEQFDKGEKLHSIPERFGRKNALCISAAIHIITSLLVIYVGYEYFQNIVYYIGAVIFIFLLIYQHLIVKPSDISRANMAFATLNGIGSIIYALFTITGMFCCQ